SRFALAEALAVDIPPRRSGPVAAAQLTVMQHLEWAAAEIEQAGGERRSPATLAEYRESAIWVRRGVTSPLFRWVEGASFSAHTEARKGGLTYPNFKALPSHTVDAVREALNRTGTRGTPETVIGKWDHE